MCKIRFWQFCDCGGHIYPWIVAKIRPVLKQALLRFVELRSINSNLQQAFVMAHEQMKWKPKAEFAPL